MKNIKGLIFTSIIINIFLILAIISQIQTLNANSKPMMEIVNLEFNKHTKYTKGIEGETKISVIKNDINKLLKKYKKNWSKTNINKLALTLQKGESVHNISYKDVLSVISIESEFKINAYNKNRNQTIDYGLTQINSDNWSNLTKQSIKLLKRYNISYENNKYDICLNVMNCFVYLANSEKMLKKIKSYSYPKMIQSYNVGLNGSLSNNKNFKRIRLIYFDKHQGVKSFLESSRY